MKARGRKHPLLPGHHYLRPRVRLPPRPAGHNPVLRRGVLHQLSHQYFRSLILQRQPFESEKAKDLYSPRRSGRRFPRARFYSSHLPRNHSDRQFRSRQPVRCRLPRSPYRIQHLPGRAVPERQMFQFHSRGRHARPLLLPITQIQQTRQTRFLEKRDKIHTQRTRI